MDQSLSRFIDEARQKGVDHPTIFLMLRAFGWKEREIAGALASRELGLPIPERAGAGSARDAFLHLLAFTALYAWAGSLVYLLFTYIEIYFPDPAERTGPGGAEAALSSIRAGLATLIVAYPLFFPVWWYLLREIRAVPERAKSGVRRWLSFLSLFVGAVTLMLDVIWAIYYFVEGDLTTRFLLKVLVLFIMTGGVFLYLALVLRSESEATK
jgi:hypothetical protein